MLEDRIVFLNGDFVAWNQATVHIMSHSFGRGSAIFEVLSLHETNADPAIFRLDKHIERLFKTAKLLNMELPISKETLHEAVMATVKRNDISKGFIKIIGFYPQIAFEIIPPQKKLDISVFVVDPAQDFGGLDFPTKRGTTVCISRWRKLDPQSVPIEAKVAANYLNGMMARSEAKMRGFENGIMLDTQGFIAEGGTESIFLVKDGRLMTPSLGTVLDSITRNSLLQAAKAIGIESLEGRLPSELLFEANEIFLSGTPFKVLPVKRIEDRVIEGTPGPFTRKLSALLDEIIAGRDERFRHWFFHVKGSRNK
ncbi:MAG: branched-chain-amino-acid transaminase [Deltaproteobacteria bacterium]|nr:branched-chain-amino-acid transaminase [Deltaproteobacteria bacterium]